MLRKRPGRASVGRSVCLGLLAAAVGCGGAAHEAGPPVVTWYVFREPSGAFDAAVERCTAAAEGRYRIATAALPADADQQREQLVRRLAARDPDIDVLAMDVIWTAEFAAAGWILPWHGEAARQARAGVLPAAVESATWEDALWAAPFTSNVQLLWYRKDLVAEPPATWSEMVAAAEALARAGKPHRIQVQGGRYEGLTVWFTSLLASAGGAVLEEGGEEVALPAGPTREALAVMARLSTSAAAPPGLATAKEDDARLAFEAGRSAFMVNYTFVWPSARSNALDLARVMGWARWPAVEAGTPGRPTIGGVNLGVGAFSRHPEQAFEAAACLRGAENQVAAATRGGLLPTLEALYDRSEVLEAFPFAPLLRESLRDAALRPRSPAYSDVSLAIQRTLHPTREIDPEADAVALRRWLEAAIGSRGLL